MFSMALAIVMLGVQAVLVQVLLIRETLAVYFGNELTIGLVFFSWLAGVGLGALGAAGWTGRIKRPLLALIVLQSAMAVMPLVQIWYVRSVRLVLGTPAGELIAFSHVFISAFILIAPFGLLVGMSFPVACAAWRARSSDVRARSIGVVYSLEALGALVGGLLYTFVFVDRVSAWTVVFGLAAIVWTVGAVACRKGGGTRAACICAALAGATALAVFAGLPDWLEDTSVVARWRSFGQPGVLLESRDTRYQNLALAESEGQYNLFANGQYVWSFPEEYEAPAAAHLVMCQHPEPRRVLLLGAPPDVLVEVLLYPVEKVDYVQLDPEMIGLIEPYLTGTARAAMSDPRVTVHYGDGRQFVKTTDEFYDLIVAQLPDPSTAALNRFYTREFFVESESRLSRGGVFATSVSAAPGYLGDEVLSYSGSVYATLHEVFDEVVVTPGSEHHMCAASEPGIVTTDADVLAGRFDRAGLQTPFFTRDHFELLVPEDRTEFVRRTYAEARNLPVNTDTNPVTYFYNLVLWDRFAGGRWAPWMMRLRRSGRLLALGAMLTAAAAVCATIIAGRKREVAGRRRMAALVAIFATGSAGMAIDLLGLYAFQNSFGYVYREAGLIVGLFMAGLTLGGVFGTALAGRAARPARWFVVAEMALVVYMIAFPTLTSWTAAHVVAGKAMLVSTVFFGALLVGFQFPLANHCFVAAGGTTSRSASFTEAADHGGACMGALFAGVILVPLFGLAGTCLAVALLKLCSLTVLAAAFKNA